MKIKSNYKIREIAGENIVVEQGKLDNDMTRIISLNNTATLLWEQLQNKDFTLQEVTTILINTYEVEEDTAQADATKWIESMKSLRIID